MSSPDSYEHSSAEEPSCSCRLEAAAVQRNRLAITSMLAKQDKRSIEGLPRDAKELRIVGSASSRLVVV